MSSSSFKFSNVQQVSPSDSPSVLNTRDTSRRASSCPRSSMICPVRHFTPQRRDCNAIDCRKCSEDALCKSTTTACKSEEKREDRQGRPRQCWDATRTLASLRCFLLPPLRPFPPCRTFLLGVGWPNPHSLTRSLTRHPPPHNATSAQAGHQRYVTRAPFSSRSGARAGACSCGYTGYSRAVVTSNCHNTSIRHHAVAIIAKLTEVLIES